MAEEQGKIQLASLIVKTARWNIMRPLEAPTMIRKWNKHIRPKRIKKKENCSGFWASGPISAIIMFAT